MAKSKRLENWAIGLTLVALIGFILIMVGIYIANTQSAPPPANSLMKLDVTFVCVDQFLSTYSPKMTRDEFSAACGQEVDDLIARHTAIVIECYNIHQDDHDGLKNCFDRNQIAFSGQFMAKASD